MTNLKFTPFIATTIISANCFAIDVVGIRADDTIRRDNPSKIAITFEDGSPSNESSNCNIKVQFGDGSHTQTRVSKSQLVNNEINLEHTYTGTGTYTIKAVGAVAFRGLNTVWGCGGKEISKKLTVVEPLAVPIQKDTEIDNRQQALISAEEMIQQKEKELAEREAELIRKQQMLLTTPSPPPTALASPTAPALARNKPVVDAKTSAAATHPPSPTPTPTPKPTPKPKTSFDGF